MREMHLSLVAAAKSSLCRVWRRLSEFVPFGRLLLATHHEYTMMPAVPALYACTGALLSLCIVCGSSITNTACRPRPSAPAPTGPTPLPAASRPSLTSATSCFVLVAAETRNTIARAAHQPLLHEEMEGGGDTRRETGGEEARKELSGERAFIAACRRWSGVAGFVWIHERDLEQTTNSRFNGCV